MGRRIAWDQVSAWDSIAQGSPPPQWPGHQDDVWTLGPRRLYENTHSAEQSEHELFWGNLAAFYHLSFVMMRNSIHYSIRKDWNDMNLGTKGNNDSSDKKISTSNICLLNNQRWQGTKKKSMASVKLIIMPQQTLNCSSSVSAAAMSNTVRINIHYSCLSLFVSPSHGWRLFMRMLCLSLLTPDLRGWPSSQGVRGKKRVE